MRTTKNKLPGRACRIVSFIPALNWLSLLYIGVINANIANIICAILYCVLTFAFPSIAPLLWIVGIVHYAIVYDNIKKNNSGTAIFPSQQANSSFQRSYKQGTQNARGFSDVTISGTTEHRQAIPNRPTPNIPQVRVSFSANTSQDKFFSDMQRYVSFEGQPAAFLPFMTYWPTYDSMNKQQQAWYFFWRSQVRRGNYPETDLSYIFIHIYELLSGVGWQTPQQGYDLLVQIWSAYKGRFPTLNHYMSDWIFDFAQLHNLLYSAPFEDDSARILPSTMTDILVEQHAEDVPLKLPFALIDALCDYSLVNSKFYKDGNQDLIQEAIPRVVALADAALRKKTQKGVLATYGPNRPKKQEYYMFRSAVCPQANKKMVFTVKAYSANPKFRGYINELVRYGENTLRELRNCRGRLRGITLDDETATLVESFLKKEYGQSSIKSIEQAKKVEVSLDFESIDILREQSDAVRDALQVEEIAILAEKSLLTDVKEVTAVYVAISPEARSYLDRLEKSGWECETRPEDEASVSEINHLAEHYLGCALLVKEQNLIATEDDYRDELSYIYENPPQLPNDEGNSQLFNLSTLPSELQEFVGCLVPEQQKALHALLSCEHPESELERIAEEAMTMPQIILDDINGMAMQVLGDLIVDAMEQEPRVMDEYLTTLKKSIA